MVVFRGDMWLSRATNHARSVKELKGEAKLFVELDDPLGSLVREHDGTGVPGEPFGGSHLLLPAETLFRITRELNVIRRIRVDEVIGLKCDCFKVGVHKIPIRKALTIGSEVPRVRDVRVPTEGHVKTAPAIEPAQPVVAGPIEVIEKRRRFLACGSSIGEELIEALAMGVVLALAVGHHERGLEAAPEPAVEVDHMGIDVVEERPLWREPKRDG